MIIPRLLGILGICNVSLPPADWHQNPGWEFGFPLISGSRNSFGIREWDIWGFGNGIFWDEGGIFWDSGMGFLRIHMAFFRIQELDFLAFGNGIF